MSLDLATLSVAVVALGGLLLALALWLTLLTAAQRSSEARLRRLFPAGEPAGLDEVLDRAGRRAAELAAAIERLRGDQRELAATARRSVQRVGLVRFNPFADTGGDQSFAIALLDADGSGIVLSSLHGRSDTRTFAKPVSAGRSSYPLSEEEQQAIQQALAAR